MNQIVSLDLTKSNIEGAGPWILYMMGMFSRFRMGFFIPNKEAVDKLITSWIRLIGPPDVLHSDNGTEFINEEMKTLCDAMNIKYTTTASKTPNANRIMEKNHYVTDIMLSKMLSADKSLRKSPEVALSWALAASNSLDNVS